jgi:hypothetical protein
MPTPIWLTGFEYGVATPTINGGGLFAAVTGAPTIQGTTKRSGNYALRVNVTSAAATNVARTISTAVLVGSVYFMVHTNPSAAVRILRFTTAAGTSPAIYYDPADNTIYPSISTAGDKSAALTLDTWYRIDFKVVVGPGGTSTLDVQLDGTAIAQKTFDQTATTMNGFYMGFMDAVTGEVFYDDVYLSYTDGDHPIGAHQVEALSPVADGTHNNTTNTMENQAGADIGVVTAYDLVNKVPLNSGTATYMRQAVIGTARYAEMTIGNLSGSIGAINGVMALLAYQSATTSTNNGKSYLYSGGTLVATIYSGDMSESSLFYKAVIGTDPGGNWGTAALAASRFRVGYSSDVTPNPYWNALMVEYDYAPSSGPAIGTIATAEASQAQSVDAALINAMYNILAGEASQGQASDAAFVELMALGIAAGEASQAQSSEAVLLGVLTRIAAAEASQAQASDAVLLGVLTGIAAAEASQAQSSDAVTATFYGVGAVTINAAEASQGQSSDAVSVAFGIEITIAAAEASQGQASDAVLLGVLTGIAAAQASQAQNSEAVGLAFTGPTWTIAGGEASQSQSSDAVTVRAITPLAGAESSQAQTSTLVVLILSSLILPGARRVRQAAQRGTSETDLRSSEATSPRAAQALTERGTLTVTARGTEDVDD